MYLDDQTLLKGMVYVMTNDDPDNEVAAFRRIKDGELPLHAFYDTGGSGTGAQVVDPLSSQGSLRLSRCRRFLFAVNAGSNTITSFRVMGDGGLVRASIVGSGGVNPNSLDSHNGILYVSNAGNSGNGFHSNITGFTINRCGRLEMIPGSTRELSTLTAQPASVLFSPGGNQLVVTERDTNRITVYRTDDDGLATLQFVNNSHGAGPFGSVFVRRNVLLVAEAGSNALSSYTLNENGQLTVISGSVPTEQLASCWVTTLRRGRYAYVSNTGSGTISIFRVGRDGTLTLLRNVRSTLRGTPLGAPIDNGISPCDRFFYVLNGNLGTITSFAIRRNGCLERLNESNLEILPTLGTQGLAVK